MEASVVLCGLGKVGWRVLEYLRTAGLPVVVVDRSANPNDARLAGVRFIAGDFREQAVLEAAGVRTATGVLIVTSDDLVNISAALLVRRLNPGVRIVLRMFNQNLTARLGRAVTNVTALSVSALAAPILALTALTGEVLAAFSVGNDRLEVAEYRVEPGSRLAGQSVGDLAARASYMLLAHVPASGQPRLLLDVEPDAVIEPGDRLVICGDPDKVHQLLHPAGDDLAEVLWAGKLRRWGRLVWRTLAETDLAVKICTAVLLTVILASAATYHYGLKESWPNSLYHTVSVIATGADMGMEGRKYEGWSKVFVSFLRLAGAALLAAFTAIVTNFLLRARLGGAFELRRIPEKGHVVVCGLGGVGYRVVQELLRSEERVVVVEAQADNPFIATCRRQGVAVVLGDATITEVLRQARADRARAVIAVTPNDLLNLEVALLVAEMSPQQRVVVRLGDPLLAETIRLAAGVRLALSVPDLAAPAFVAGLLGDRVQAMFLAGGRMVAVLEIAIPPDESRLTGQPLRAVAVDYHVLPVAVVHGSNQTPITEPGYCLQAGDRMVVVAALPDVERLLRREPLPAEWSVEVTAFPLPVRDDLVVRLRAFRKLPADEAEALVNGNPFVLVEALTRGQAEDLLVRLRRERVSARLVRANEGGNGREPAPSAPG